MPAVAGEVLPKPGSRRVSIHQVEEHSSLGSCDRGLGPAPSNPAMDTLGKPEVIGTTEIGIQSARLSLKEEI